MHVLATGQVQGVGFRATTQMYAMQLKLRGSARNLSDGSVEIYLSGSQPMIQKLLDTLKNDFDCSLSAKEVEDNRSFDRFSIEG